MVLKFSNGITGGRLVGYSADADRVSDRPGPLAVFLLPCVHLCIFRDGAEQLSVDRAMRAASRAEIVVMVLDGSEGVTQQVGTVLRFVFADRSSLQCAVCSSINSRHPGLGSAAPCKSVASVRHVLLQASRHS
jgi:hypothetical protein